MVETNLNGEQFETLKDSKKMLGNANRFKPQKSIKLCRRMNLSEKID